MKCWLLKYNKTLIDKECLKNEVNCKTIMIINYDIFFCKTLLWIINSISFNKILYFYQNFSYLILNLFYCSVNTFKDFDTDIPHEYSFLNYRMSPTCKYFTNFYFCFSGILLQGKNQLDEAILSYQRAIHFRPSLARK